MRGCEAEAGASLSTPGHRRGSTPVLRATAARRRNCKLMAMCCSTVMGRMLAVATEWRTRIEALPNVGAKLGVAQSL